VQEFDDARDADDAVYDLNGKTLCGERYVIYNCFKYSLFDTHINVWIFIL